MEKALESLRAAVDLLPDREEGLWGLASALLHVERYDEALAAYEKLTAAFPGVPRYLFEHGQILILTGRAAEGLDKIKTAMTETREFDAFLGALARLYADNGLTDAARQAAELHLRTFPHDRDVKALLETLSAK